MVEFDELLLTSYFAMFAGVCQVIIDEGRNFMTCSIFDLVNECFIKQGQPPVLTKSEYPIMNTLNSLRFLNNKLWVITSEDKADEKLVTRKITPIIERDCIKVFTDETECKKYGKEYVNKKEISIDINRLQDIIKILIENNIKNVEFVIDNVKTKMSATKLYNILQRMNI
ncbi:hypothetical protein [Clostridium acetobutylicum]|nr:hypothetical protein [Clostridium acetobutylicum]